MTNDFNLTWVEWLDADLFLSADSGGVIQLHHFDLARLTKKITTGKYEDKEEAKRTFNEHAPFGVYQVRVKPGSTEIFASCSVDCTVRVWSAKNKKEPLLHTLEGHVGYVTAIQWVPGSDKIISASFDYSLRIWDSSAGRCLHSLERHKDAVTRLSLSADNNYIVSSGQDGDLHFWDAKVLDSRCYFYECQLYHFRTALTSRPTKVQAGSCCPSGTVRVTRSSSPPTR